MSIKKTIQASLLLVAVLCLLNAQHASALGGKLLDQTGCACCPVCDHVCKLEAEKVEVEKTCYNVEAKVICIPRVVFPWQKARKSACAACDSCDGAGCTACVHNGARVRKVCVLKKETYKCPACEYTWSAEKKDTCGCGQGSCSGGACCDSGCAGCDSGCAGCDSGCAGCDSGCAGCDSGCAGVAIATEGMLTSSPISPSSISRPSADPAILDAADYYRQPAVVLPTPLPIASRPKSLLAH